MLWRPFAHQSLVLLLCLAPAVVGAEELRVGLVGSSPFKVRDAGTFEGVAVELWHEVGYLQKWRYRFTDFERVPEALRALEQGRVDVLVGSISVTSKRARLVDFTQPYYVSHTGILTRRTATSIWKTVKPFLRTTFLYGVISLLSVLFIVGNLFYFAERRHNEMLPAGYLNGLGIGMWFAVVTFTTVGYGDIAPRTSLGRLIASGWMVIAMLTASSITAGIATSFTLLQLRHAAIESTDSLAGKKVSVVQGTTGVATARRYRAQPLVFPNKDEALKALMDGKVQAMLFDYPVLRYYLNKNPSDELVAIESRDNQEFYAFAVRRNSPLLSRVSQSLLEVLERGELKEIRERWGM